MNKVVEYLQSFVTIVLILAGIGGLAYDLFKKDGLLGHMFERFWNAQVDYPMIAIPVTIAVVVIGKMWHSHQVAKGYTSRLPDLFIYVIMGAGIYYLWRFYGELFS